MFRQRLITALIIIPLVFLGIYYVPVHNLMPIILMTMLVAGWEWLNLVPIVQWPGKIIFLLILCFAIWFCIPRLDIWLTLDLISWLGIIWAVLTFPKSQAVWGHPWLVAVLGLWLLPTFAAILFFLLQTHFTKNLMVYILALVCAADSGAYLIGKYAGRHKLIPAVSPGKTVEGMVGGIFLALLVAVVGYAFFKPASTVLWFGLALLTILISMVGDLFISILKRRCHLKDSGSIFPGHGGMLDRLDSLLAAFPLFYFGLPFIKWSVH